MAVTKTIPIKATVKKAIDYICNPDKTDNQLLVSSFACTPETADIEFEFTRQMAMEKGNNLARHLIQSFEPGEVTPEQAHKIGKRLADEVLGGKYQYVLTTHIDKGHVHNHIVFNAVNFMDYHKYHSNKRSYHEIRNTSDRICKDYGLSIVKQSRNKGKTYKEYTAVKEGTSWKVKLQVAIDNCVSQSSTFEEFLQKLKVEGYEIKQGKNIAFRADGQERFTRAKTLGENYTEDSIRTKIKECVTVKTEQTGINPLIDIQKFIEGKTNTIGLERWAKINNLKQADKSLNFLTENNILEYPQLQAKIKEMNTSYKQTGDTLKTVDNSINDLAILMKDITAYQKTKPIYEQYQKAVFKDGFKKQNESELIIYEAAKKAIKNKTIDGKLPNIKTLKLEYDKLLNQKDKLYSEYSKLKKIANEYGIAKDNIDKAIGMVSNQQKKLNEIEI